MTKPSWNDAPRWAKWLTQNSHGMWVWHEKEPELRELPSLQPTDGAKVLKTWASSGQWAIATAKGYEDSKEQRK